MIDIANILGMVGVAMILVVYALLQTDVMDKSSLSYSMINFIGSALILFSLMHAWNLPSFIIEVAWLVISAYGIYRCMVRKQSVQQG